MFVHPANSDTGSVILPRQSAIVFDPETATFQLLLGESEQASKHPDALRALSQVFFKLIDEDDFSELVEEFVAVC